MPKKPASSWSFSKTARACRKVANDPDKIRELIGFFTELNGRANQYPAIYALDPARSVGDLWIWRAIALVEREPQLAFRYFHLTLRGQALKQYVFLVRVRELYSTWEADGYRGKRPPINVIGPIDLAEIAMLGATAFALHEDEMGDWFFQRCFEALTRPEKYVEADAISGGSVGPYLLRLYSFWRGLVLDPRLREALYSVDLGPFQAVFDEWNSPEELKGIIHSLADLHAFKAVNYTYPTEDGIYSLSGWRSEFPAELLLLMRVRSELGLPTIRPSHPMLDHPLAQVPDDDFTSGYDEYLATAIESVRKAGMPDLRIPWEERWMAAGPTDPKRIIL